MIYNLDRRFKELWDGINFYEKEPHSCWDVVLNLQVLKVIDTETLPIFSRLGIDAEAVTKTKKALHKKLKTIEVTDRDRSLMIKMFRMVSQSNTRHMLTCVAIGIHCSTAEYDSLLQALDLTPKMIELFAYYFLNFGGITMLEIHALIMDGESELYKHRTYTPAGVTTITTSASVMRSVEYAMAYKYGPPVLKQLLAPGLIVTDLSGEITVEPLLVEDAELDELPEEGIVIIEDEDDIKQRMRKQKINFDSPDMEREAWLRNVLDNMLLIATELQTRVMVTRDPNLLEPVTFIFKGMLNFMSSKDIIGKESKKGKKVLPLSLEKRNIIQNMREMVQVGDINII